MSIGLANFFSLLENALYHTLDSHHYAPFSDSQASPIYLIFFCGFKYALLLV